MTPDPIPSALFTDLYELTMAAVYFGRGMTGSATFSAFVRDSGQARNFYVAAGLEDLLGYLQGLRFSDTDIAYLRSTGLFNAAFLAFLEQWRFRGDVHALGEGTLFFPAEPVVEITAPIIDAQLVETLVLNTVGLQTLIASKAARCRLAAGHRPLVDFSLRRTQGVDAGMKVARSTYLAGFDGTSNVLAAKRYGLPAAGTMAHSFVMAFANETDAFRAYAAAFPHNSIFLIDTYDTLAGARCAATVGVEMAARGHKLIGVRLDSGDMVALSRRVRQILDDTGLADVKIYASSSFDEWSIRQVLADGAAIDAFGVGTKVGVSADHPFLDIVYKMVCYDNRPVCKFSPQKQTLPGAKQVFRFHDPDGRMVRDVIGLRNERLANARPLLEAVMAGGVPTGSSASLAELRRRFEAGLAGLGKRYQTLERCAPFPVALSDPLTQALGRLHAAAGAIGETGVARG